MSLKFQSPTNEPVHISLTSGHATIVGVEPTEIDVMFHREAIALGCVTVSGKTKTSAKKPDATPEFDRAAVIRDVMIAMISDGNEDDFTKNSGIPKIDVVRQRAGFGVQREEMQQCWENLVAELGNEEDGEEEQS